MHPSRGEQMPGNRAAHCHNDTLVRNLTTPPTEPPRSPSTARARTPLTRPHSFTDAVRRSPQHHPSGTSASNEMHGGAAPERAICAATASRRRPVGWRSPLASEQRHDPSDDGESSVMLTVVEKHGLSVKAIGYSPAHMATLAVGRGCSPPLGHTHDRHAASRRGRNFSPRRLSHRSLLGVRVRHPSPALAPSV
jgi:hypothetical protein